MHIYIVQLEKSECELLCPVAIPRVCVCLLWNVRIRLLDISLEAIRSQWELWQCAARGRLCLRKCYNLEVIHATSYVAELIHTTATVYAFTKSNFHGYCIRDSSCREISVQFNGRGVSIIIVLIIKLAVPFAPSLCLGNLINYWIM